MGKVIIEEESLYNIGEAIRGKLNTSTTYRPKDMARAISMITGGSGTKLSDFENDVGFITLENIPAWARQNSKPSYTAQEVGALPEGQTIASELLPSASVYSAGVIKVGSGLSITDGVLSATGGGGGGITQETDPTVPSWAKQSSKPTYTAQEVGALPSSTSIPSKTSDLTNDSGFITSVPTASASTLGLVKVGSGLSISDGVLSATGGGGTSDYTQLTNRPAIVQGTGTNATLENSASTASGTNSHAEGSNTQATGSCAHAEGNGSIAGYKETHAEGYATQTSSKIGAHAEGCESIARGSGSHAEGDASSAIGDCSHAEGQGAYASGLASHAEGFYCESSGSKSHAEGHETYSYGDYSHSEGYKTKAKGDAAHAEGINTVAVSGANSLPQSVSGRYNKIDTSNGSISGTPLGTYAHIIGNGTGDSSSNRSNLLGIRWDGVIEINNADIIDGQTIKRTQNGQLYVDIAYIAQQLGISTT